MPEPAQIPLSLLAGDEWPEAFARLEADDVFRALVGDSVSVDLVTIDTVVELYWALPGEPGGAGWLAGGQLADGRYFSLAADCDYSGWFRSTSRVRVASTYPMLVWFGLTPAQRVDLGFPRHWRGYVNAVFSPTNPTGGAPRGEHCSTCSGTGDNYLWNLTVPCRACFGTGLRGLTNG